MRRVVASSDDKGILTNRGLKMSFASNRLHKHDEENEG